MLASLGREATPQALPPYTGDAKTERSKNDRVNKQTQARADKKNRDNYVVKEKVAGVVVHGRHAHQGD